MPKVKKLKKTPFMYVCLAFSLEDGALTLGDIAESVKNGEASEDGDFVLGCPGPIGESLVDLSRSMKYTKDDLLSDVAQNIRVHGKNRECLSLFTGC
jgi:hypothetical protein